MIGTFDTGLAGKSSQNILQCQNTPDLGIFGPFKVDGLFVEIDIGQGAAVSVQDFQEQVQELCIGQLSHCRLPVTGILAAAKAEHQHACIDRCHRRHAERHAHTDIPGRCMVRGVPDAAHTRAKRRKNRIGIHLWCVNPALSRQIAANTMVLVR